MSKYEYCGEPFREASIYVPHDYYYCCDCERISLAEDMKDGPGGEWDERILICPLCGSDDLIPVEPGDEVDTDDDEEENDDQPRTVEI